MSTNWMPRVMLRALACTTALTMPALAAAQDQQPAPPPPPAQQEEAAGVGTSPPVTDTNEQEITVTATRIQTVVSEVPASISILSGENLQNQLDVSVDLNDVLTKAVPGLVANNERGFSNGRGPLLRGRPASVLINGVPVNQIQRSSGFDLGLIDPLAIDRIEVNRGATAVFGFGASGGVINVLTRRGRTARPAYDARVQTIFSTEDFEESLGFKTYVGGGYREPNGFDLHLGAGFSRIGASIDPRGDIIESQAVNIYNLDGNLGYEFAGGAAIRVNGNFFRRNFRKSYEGPGYLFGACATDDCDTLYGGFDPRVAVQTPDPDQDRQYQQNYVFSLNFSHPDVLGSLLDVTLYTQKNTFLYRQLFSDFSDPPTLYLLGSRQNNNRLGFRSNLTSEFSLFGDKDFSLTYGFDFLRDNMTRPAVLSGSETAPLRYVPAGVTPFFTFGDETRPFSPPVTLDSYAGFAQATLDLGRFILNGGLRHEEFRPRSRGKVVEDFFGPGEDLVYLEGDMPKFNATLVNAGLVWQPTDRIEIFLGLSQGLEVTEIGRAFRSLPRFTRNSSGELVNVPGDPALVDSQPAKTTQYEIGYRGRHGPLRLTASAYYSDAPLSSQLQFISPFVPLEPLRQPERIWGFEATADYRFGQGFATGAVLTYQNGEYEDEDGAEFDLANDRVTPTRLTVYAEAAPAAGISLRAQATHVFDRKQFGDDDGPVLFGTFEGDVEGFTVVDLLGQARIGPGELSVGIENLLNKKYVVPERQAFNDLYDYFLAEGRKVTVGYQLRF
jgi:iron complex outermembrane recepter protein